MTLKDLFKAMQKFRNGEIKRCEFGCIFHMWQRANGIKVAELPNGYCKNGCL